MFCSNDQGIYDSGSQIGKFSDYMYLSYFFVLFCFILGFVLYSVLYFSFFVFTVFINFLNYLYFHRCGAFPLASYCPMGQENNISKAGSGFTNQNIKLFKHCNRLALLELPNVKQNICDHNKMSQKKRLLQYRRKQLLPISSFLFKLIAKN